MILLGIHVALGGTTLGSPATAAPEFRAGALVGAVADPADAFGGSATSYAPGGALVVPVRWNVRPGTSLRAALDLNVAGGHDVVTWTESDAAFQSSDHWSMVSAARIFLGPEVDFRPEASWTPYVGGGVGGGAVWNFHSFGGDTALLLDPTQNALEDDGNIDPYTVSWVPAVEVHGGFRVGKRVALEVEVGYAASYIPAAPLRKSQPELGARRTAYALDLARVAVGISAPL